MTLLRAAIEGRAADLRLILAQKREDVNAAMDEGGITPLIATVRHAESGAECVRVLLEAGAQVNLCDKQGVSPLHDACRRGALEIVQLLCGAGADPSAKNAAGDSAHDVAVRAAACGVDVISA